MPQLPFDLSAAGGGGASGGLRETKATAMLSLLLSHFLPSLRQQCKAFNCPTQCPYICTWSDYQLYPHLHVHPFIYLSLFLQSIDVGSHLFVFIWGSSVICSSSSEAFPFIVTYALIHEGCSVSHFHWH